MRLSVLSVVIVAGLLSFSLPPEVVAAPGVPHLPFASADGSIQNIYYYHGRYYPYHYHGHYYAHRYYRSGRWYYR
jgi:hypothetical protein